MKIQLFALRLGTLYVATATAFELNQHLAGGGRLLTTSTITAAAPWIRLRYGSRPGLKLLHAASSLRVVATERT